MLKTMYDHTKNLFEPFGYAITAIFAWLISHIHVGASILALFVLAYNLKLVYYKAKREKQKFEKGE